MNKKSNEKNVKLGKGFTLVELIGVIILLGVIALMAYPTITKTIDNSKEKAYAEQIRQIENAASRYGLDNYETLPTMDSISLSTLISEGYIVKTKDKKLYDPRDNTELTGCVIVRYQDNQYVYEYDQNCEKSTAANCFKTEPTLSDYDINVSKCTTFFVQDGLSNEEAQTFCSGGEVVVDGIPVTFRKLLKLRFKM